MTKKPTPTARGKTGTASQTGKPGKPHLKAGDLLPFGSGETFRTLVENLNEVIFTLDVEGKVVYVSPIIERETEFRVDEVMGTLFTDYIHPEDLVGLKENFIQTMAGANRPLEFRIQGKSGTIHHVSASSRVLEVDGHVVGLTGVLSDITERKNAQDALRQAEEKFRNMVEWIPAAVYTDAIDEVSTSLYMGPQIEKITGYAPEEWMDDAWLWLKLIHPQDRAGVEAENERTNRTGEPFMMEYRLMARDGHQVWVRDEAALLRDASGLPLCWQGVIFDISERKQEEQSRLVAEKELRTSEEQYRQMVELSPEAIAVHAQGKLIFVNPAAVHLIGAQTADQVIGRPITEFIHPDSRELAAERIQEAFDLQKALPVVQEKFIRVDGSIVDVEVATMPIIFQGKKALQVLIKDITERKQSQALQEAVYQIAMAAEATRSLNDLFPRIHKIITSVMPAENFYITLYDEARDILRFPYFQDVQDEPYMGEIQPGKGLTAHVLRTGKSLLCTQAVHDELERQGAIRLLGVPSAIWLGVPLMIDGKTIGAMVVQHYTDPHAYSEREQHMLEFVSSQVAAAITRKQAEEALQDSEDKFRRIVNASPMGMHLYELKADQRLVLIGANPSADQILGINHAELIGKTIEQAFPALEQTEVPNRYRQVASDAISWQTEQVNYEDERIRGAYEVIVFQISQGRIAVLFQNVTERRQAEEDSKRKLKELSVLHAISVAGTEAVTIDDLLERSTRIIVETLSPDNFGVMLYDARTRLLHTHPSYHEVIKSNASTIFPLGKGVTGHVAASGIPHRVADTRKEKRYIGITPGMRSELCVPIKAGEELLGVLNAESQVKGFFSVEDERLFVTIASTLATAIQKLRLFTSEHTRRQEAETLRQAVAVVTSSLALNDVLDDILASLRKVVAYDSASVVLKLPESDLLEIVAGRGLPEGLNVIGKRYRESGKWQQLLRTHKAIIMEDAQTDPRFDVWEGSEYIRGWMAVPLIVRDNVIGYISLDSRHTNAYSEENAILAQNFGYTAAMAVENARLFESEHKRRQEADTLRQAAAAVSSSLDLPQVLDAILISLRQVIPYDSASVMLLGDEKLTLAAVQGFDNAAEVQGMTFPANDTLFYETQTSRQPIILKDACQDDRFQKWAGTDYVRGWMGAPLIVRDTVIGYITLNNRQPDTYGQEQAGLVQSFAYQAATAIDNARLYQAELRRRQEAETLRQVGQVVSSSLDVDEIFRLILEQLKQVLTFDTASVILLGESDQPDLVTGMNYADEKMTSQAAFELLKGSLILKYMKETLEPLILADVRQQPDWIWVPGAEHVRSFLAVPIINRQKMTGVLMADSKIENFFKPDDLQVAQSLAQHLSIAIENARLFELEQHRRSEAETLREAVSIVASTLNAEQSIRLILEQLERVVPYDSASVQILTGNTLEIVGGRGWENRKSVLGMRFDVPGDNPNTVVVEERKPLILGIARQHYPLFALESHQHIKSWMGVPLVAKNEVIGMLAVDSFHENSFSEDSARLASLFANQVAAALENSRLYAQALQASERRVVLHRASQEIARAAFNSEQVYKAVHQAAAQLMPAEAFVISLLDEPNHEVLSVYLYEKSGRWPPTRSPADAGLSGEVIASGKPVIIKDLKEESLPAAIHFGDGDEEDVRSILAVPMRLGEKVIGMLSAQSYTPHSYTAEDQALLEMLAAHAAVAIENSRLYKETHQRLTELELVNRISTTLREAQTVPEMLPRLLDETLQALHSEAGAIWLYDPSRMVLRETVSRGWFARIDLHPMQPDEGIAGAVFQSGQPFIARDFSTDEAMRASSRVLVPPGWGGACVPIRTMQEIIGVLFFSVQLPRQVLPEDLHLLTTICEITGNAVRRADLYTQTQRQVQRLASLRAIDMAINTILDLRVTLGILIDHIQTQLKVDAVDFMLLNPHTQTLHHAASSGFHTDAVNHWQVHIGDDIAGRSVRTRSTIQIQNFRENTVSKRLLNLSVENFVSYFCVPLIAKGQVKGVLEIYHRAVLEPDADWRTFMETLAGQAAIAIDNSVLFEDLQKSNTDLAMAYDATIEGWSKALDLRDRETEGHTQRVTELTLQLAQILKVSDLDQVHVRRGALLHDIGKMGVPDIILNKPGELTEEEWVIMRRHPVFAYEMLHPITYLRPAVDIPFCHHERWNGSGYPRGLKGEEIPLPARLFAVVDVWDALTSDRPYRKAWTKEDAVDFLRANSGVLFDPVIVEVFLKMEKTGEE